MKSMRRKEKEIQDKSEIIKILKITKYLTIAMSKDKVPYLVTLTHGYDSKKNVIYFHCAKKCKKIDILKENNVVWGQALIDKGYVEGKCDHLYATAQFMGTVTFLEDFAEKQHALQIMIKQQESIPVKVIEKQITNESVKNVNIGKIEITYLSGKKSDEVIIS